MPQRDVAEIVGVTQGVVSKTYARYLELGTHKDRPIQIRQRVTTEQQDRLVCQIARRNPNVSHPELQRQLLAATRVNVSVETIRKRLRARGLYSKSYGSHSYLGKTKLTG